MILVGSGSFLFHATLRYEWQLADELPSKSRLSSIQVLKQRQSNAIILLCSGLRNVSILVLYRLQRRPTSPQAGHPIPIVLGLVLSCSDNRLLNHPEPSLPPSILWSFDGSSSSLLGLQPGPNRKNVPGQKEGNRRSVENVFLRDHYVVSIGFEVGYVITSMATLMHNCLIKPCWFRILESRQYILLESERGAPCYRQPVTAHARVPHHVASWLRPRMLRYYYLCAENA